MSRRPLILVVIKGVDVRHVDRCHWWGTLWPMATGAVRAVLAGAEWGRQAGRMVRDADAAAAGLLAMELQLRRLSLHVKWSEVRVRLLAAPLLFSSPLPAYLPARVRPPARSPSDPAHTSPWRRGSSFRACFYCSSCLFSSPCLFPAPQPPPPPRLPFWELPRQVCRFFPLPPFFFCFSSLRRYPHSAIARACWLLDLRCMHALWWFPSWRAFEFRNWRVSSEAESWKTLLM